jgi:hypothetical protein
LYPRRARLRTPSPHCKIECLGRQICKLASHRVRLVVEAELNRR